MTWKTNKHKFIAEAAAQNYATPECDCAETAVGGAEWLWRALEEMGHVEHSDTPTADMANGMIGGLMATAMAATAGIVTPDEEKS